MANMLDEIGVVYAVDAPLAGRTWYGVGGPARYLAHPADFEQLATLVQRCRDAGQRLLVLGEGANLLVRDEGVDAVVVKLDAEPFRRLRIDGRRVVAGGGHDLPRLVIETARAGLAGLECLAGIPGTVGGAVRMNAGGTYGDIGTHISRVTVMDRDGQIFHRTRDDLRFGYRSSNIVAPLILAAEFELSEEDPEEIRRQVKEVFFYKKSSQPLVDRSAGCAFKNLTSLPEDVEGDLPLAAGALIDRAGLKGHRIGTAVVSERHANFIVVDEGGKANDVLALMEHIQATVRGRFGVDLEPEVVVW